MSEGNVEAVRRVFEEWEKGNLSAGTGLYDPDIVLVPLERVGSRRYIGLDGVSEFTRDWLSAVTDLTLTADELIEAGDSVVVAVRQRGIGKGSGAPGEIRYFQVWSFRGGLVIRFQAFHHREDALEAVGLSE